MLDPAKVFDDKFDDLMQDLHRIVIEHRTMRNLIENCNDYKFLEYFMGQMEFFRKSDSAKAFFDSHYTMFKAKHFSHYLELVKKSA